MVHGRMLCNTDHHDWVSKKMSNIIKMRFEGKHYGIPLKIIRIFERPRKSLDRCDINFIDLFDACNCVY